MPFRETALEGYVGFGELVSRIRKDALFAAAAMVKESVDFTSKENEHRLPESLACRRVEQFLPLSPKGCFPTLVLPVDGLDRHQSAS